MKSDGSAARRSSQPELKKARKTEKNKTEAILDDDSREAWNIKMTKWASGAFGAVVSSQFWLCLEISQRVRGPLTHFFLWAQKQKGHNVFFQLVTHKARELLSEYRQLADTIDGWFQNAVTESGSDDLPPELLNMMKAMAFKLVLSGLQTSTCGW